MDRQEEANYKWMDRFFSVHLNSSNYVQPYIGGGKKSRDYCRAI